MNSTEYTRLRNLLVVVAAAMVVTVVLIWIDGRAQTSRIVDARTEARYRECVRDNDRSDLAVANARSEAQVLIAAAKAAGRASDDVVNESYITAQEQAARKLYPSRSCTPEAIEDYYKEQAAR